jgi:F0F1-type ATP synthase assembly protein I
MKSLLLIGACSGFFCGMAFSLIQEESWFVSTWHGALTAIIASLLLVWWDRAWKRHEHEMTDKPAADSLITASNTANTSKT